MSQRRVVLLLILALALLAAGLRFFRLGDWSFTGDEFATVGEAESLAQPLDGPPTTQHDRLPRLLIASYSLHRLDYALFGSDELGSRVFSALLGTLNVLLVFLVLDRSLGRATALATALLMALWPEHLYRSQENRFYIVATVFAATCMLSGALAVQRHSLLWTALACAAAIGALLSHTVEAVLFGGLVLGIGVAAWRAKDTRMLRLLGVVGAGSLFAAGVFVFYVLPLVRGWNNNEAWGFSSAHSVISSVSQFGWPIVLLALLGALSVWKNGGVQEWYWLSWAAVWAAGCLLLPFVLTYHPG